MPAELHGRRGDSTMVEYAPQALGPCFMCTSDSAGSNSAGPNRRQLLSSAILSPVAALAAGLQSRPSVAQVKAARPRPPDKVFVIASGCALLENDGELQVVRGANILVRDGVIADISNGPINGSLPIIDARGDLALPGFISGHTHCASATPTRGIIESGRFYGEPFLLVEKLSDEELDALTAFNLAELLRSGCTSQVELSRSLRQVESYVRVAKRWGVRGFPGPQIPGAARLFDISFRDSDDVLFASEEGTITEIEQSLAFAKRNMNAADGLIVPIMAAHATDTHTEKTLRVLQAACIELGTGLQIHFAQSSREAAVVKRLWNVTPAQWLESLGMLDQPVFGAHMGGMDWAIDGPILKRHGTIYAHCPSGGGAGGGTQPYPEALAAGVATNIGIDTHSNDYLENLKLAVLYGQARHSLLSAASPVPMKSPTVWDAIDSATRNPARALRRPDLGRISIGAQADIITVDVSGFLSGSGAIPPEPLYNLLYCNGMMVRHVMTAGRIQVYDGQLTVADEAEVIAAGGKVVEKIWAALERQGWFSNPPSRRRG